MAHDRKLVIGGVALTKAKLPARANAAATNRVQNEIEREIINSGFLEGAPFRWVGLLIRKGLVDENEPHYGKINAQHGDLPLAIEIDVHRLLGATEDQMAAIYRKAVLISLIHAGERYGRRTDTLKSLLGAEEHRREI